MGNPPPGGGVSPGFPFPSKFLSPPGGEPFFSRILWASGGLVMFCVTARDGFSWTNKVNPTPPHFLPPVKGKGPLAPSPRRTRVPPLRPSPPSHSQPPGHLPPYALPRPTDGFLGPSPHLASRPRKSEHKPGKPHVHSNTYTSPRHYPHRKGNPHWSSTALGVPQSLAPPSALQGVERRRGGGCLTYPAGSISKHAGGGV